MFLTAAVLYCFAYSDYCCSDYHTDDKCEILTNHDECEVVPLVMDSQKTINRVMGTDTIYELVHMLQGYRDQQFVGNGDLREW